MDPSGLSLLPSFPDRPSVAAIQRPGAALKLVALHVADFDQPLNQGFGTVICLTATVTEFATVAQPLTIIQLNQYRRQSLWRKLVHPTAQPTWNLYTTEPTVR